MNKSLVIVCFALSLAGVSGLVSAKGCLKGAAVGGVAGHVAGHHGVLGAAAGCAVGHHRAKVADEKAAADAKPVQDMNTLPAAAAQPTKR